MKQYLIRPDSARFTAILGVLAALPAISIDISIPALLRMQQEFSTTSGFVGQTITLFMVGFALGQFGAGPLSDGYGRRPVLLAGLSVYCIAGAGCALASSIELLVGWRLLQGIAAGACSVMAFAMIRDLFEGEAARSKRTYVTVVFGIAPMLAPTLGAALMRSMAWQPIFLALTLAGILLLIAIALGVAESRPKPLETSQAGGTVGFAYMTVLRDRRFTTLAVINGLSYGGMFAYIAGSAVVLMGSLGLTPQVYAGFFACTAASITAGAWVSARCARLGVGSARLVWFGLMGAALSAAALCVLVLSDTLRFEALIPLLIMNLFCRGVVSPNVQHMALDPMRVFAGTAAAAVGVVQIMTGAIASALVSVALVAVGPAGMTLVMAGLAIAALAIWLVARVDGRASAPG